MSATSDAIRRIVASIRSSPELYESLTDASDLVTDVALDSLETLQLMLEIESTLAVQIDFDKLEFSYLRSIAKLAAFLDEMPRRPNASSAE